jgi:uncharacterized protein (DUF2336 family)
LALKITTKYGRPARGGAAPSPPVRKGQMSQTLSRTDVQALLDDPSAASRARTAEKLAVQYSGDALSSGERKIAEDIIRVMARDLEQDVRETLSRNLKDCAGLAHDIAVTMASDVEAVSLPVIRYSGVLTDADLIQIVRSRGPAQQTAIARRAMVSAAVADALVGAGDESVVSTLVGNEGAAISETTFRRVVEEFGGSEAVTRPLTRRANLPVGIAERLVNIVSERLRDELVTRHDLPPEVATQVVLQSRERATLGLLGGGDAMSVSELVAHLDRNGRLTPSIVLRALCMGDVEFFEAGAAALAGLQVDAARALIHDDGPLGLPALMKRAAFPDSTIPVARAAVDVVRDTQYDGQARDRERFRRRMLERVLTRNEDSDALLGEDNAEYLLERLCGLQGAFRAA